MMFVCTVVHDTEQMSLDKISLDVKGFKLPSVDVFVQKHMH